MAKISRADFKYYKDKMHKDKDFHGRQFIKRINPDLIDSYFEGYPTLGDQSGQSNDAYRSDEYSALPNRLTLNSLFPTTSTLIAQFYPQNPKFVGVPKRDQDQMSAKVAASAMNYYYEQMGAEKENQKAILSAWMYGVGITKQGWRTDFRRVEPVGVTPSENIAQKIKRAFTNTPNMEEVKDNEYIASEGPFLEYVDARNLYFDSEQPMGKGRVIHQRIPKTLYELKTSPIYNVSSDFVNRFKTKGDERNVLLDLYETWVWMPDGLYVLAYVNEWDEPLRWDKTPYAAEGFPYKILTLTDQVNRIYPVSHMKVAQRLQRTIDYILTLQKNHIEKHKSVSVFDGDAFDDDDRAKIKRNEIGLNVFTKNGRPAQSAAQHVGGNTIPPDMFAVQNLLRANLKEILSVVGARSSGESEVDTATQEKIADFGNTLRSVAMQSKIREFMISQGRKLLGDMKQFATAPAIFEITGLDLIDPETMQPVTESWIEFSTTRNPEVLRDIIPKEMDITVDITNTSDRSLSVMRKQLFDFGNLVSSMQPVLAQQGYSFNVKKFLKRVGETFETIDNAEEFFDKIQMQPQMGGPQEVPTQGMGDTSPESIEQAVNQIGPM